MNEHWASELIMIGKFNMCMCICMYNTTKILDKHAILYHNEDIS